MCGMCWSQKDFWDDTYLEATFDVWDQLQNLLSDQGHRLQDNAAAVSSLVPQPDEL